MSKFKRFVEPKVFLLGYTSQTMAGILSYLEYTGQEDFYETLQEVDKDGVEPAEALISMYAKLCYKSLVIGQNANLSQVRDIKGNLAGILKSAHGSVLEHVSMNFIVTDCSRILTHEQVRHRVGAAYSQTSGRYCRIEPGTLQLVLDPILNGCEDLGEAHIEFTERTIYLIECRKGLRKPPYGLTADQVPMDAAFRPILSILVDGKDLFDVVMALNSNNAIPTEMAELVSRTWDEATGEPKERLTDKDMDELREHLTWIPTGKADGVGFAYKKKVTSAARRFAPNGQSNEIGMTLNIRTLRHVIMMRTARFAEWEIRVVYERI